MGYLIRVKSNAEKSQVCDRLRSKGLSQMVTPFRTRDEDYYTGVADATEVILNWVNKNKEL